MTELDKLLIQKEKAENIIASSKTMTSKQLIAYDRICRRITNLQILKALNETAPLSMDPEKCKDHWNAAKILFQKIGTSDEITQLLSNGETVFSEFKPQTVQHYSKNFKNFSKQFIMLWKKTNQY